MWFSQKICGRVTFNDFLSCWNLWIYYKFGFIHLDNTEKFTIDRFCWDRGRGFAIWLGNIYFLVFHQEKSHVLLVIFNFFFQGRCFLALYGSKHFDNLVKFYFDRSFIWHCLLKYCPYSIFLRLDWIFNKI